MSYVVYCAPSNVHFSERFCPPITILKEFKEQSEAQQFCYDNFSFENPLTYHFCSKNLFLKLAKAQKRLIEKERQKRLKFISEYRIKLANCSANTYRCYLKTKTDTSGHLWRKNAFEFE